MEDGRQFIYILKAKNVYRPNVENISEDEDDNMSDNDTKAITIVELEVPEKSNNNDELG